MESELIEYLEIPVKLSYEQNFASLEDLPRRIPWSCEVYFILLTDLSSIFPDRKWIFQLFKNT